MLITNATVITWGAENHILEAYAILVRDGVIAALGPTRELVATHPTEEKLDAAGQLVMPGNICAHTHFYGACARGMVIPGAPAKDFPEILEKLWRPLDLALDEEGNIRDQASPLLAELRAQVRQVEARIRKQLTELIQDHQLASLLQDDFITQRSGRWVIPVRMETRKQIRGVVHDVSRSGETAFVEPLAIIQLSNGDRGHGANQSALLRAARLRDRIVGWRG